MGKLEEYRELHVVLSAYYEKAVRACVEHEVFLGDNCTLGQTYLGNAAKEAVQYVAAMSIGEDATKRLQCVSTNLIDAVLESRKRLIKIGVERAYRAVLAANAVAVNEAQVEQTRQWNAELLAIVRRALTTLGAETDLDVKGQRLRELYLQAAGIRELATDARADWLS
jgi:hypothetical protein